MKNQNKNLIVPFAGLKDGNHSFQFEIGKHFFDQFDYSLIESGNVTVEMELNKKINMLTAVFNVFGELDTICDRCTDALKIEIKNNYQLVFKFGNEASNNENLIVLPPNAYELHLDNYIYEFINLCLPLKKIHPKGACNKEMEALMAKYVVNPLEEKEDEDDWLEE